MSGPPWLGNAKVFELNRINCLEAAGRAYAMRNVEGAHECERNALDWAVRRDREQRLEERRAMNRHLNTRRRFGPRREP